MLGFMNIAALLGFLGVALPILIHLFAKQKVRRVEFSSTVFLKRIQNQSMRRMKLRQMLLLILRCLAVFLLVVAFARPTVRTHSVSQHGTSRSSVVLIIDQSMSMGRNVLFRRAQERASSVFELLHPDDETALVWTVPPGTEEPGFFHARSDLENRLASMYVSSAGAVITTSIKEAEKLLMRSRNINREIFLVSDIQAAGFAPVTDSAGVHTWDGSVFVLPISGETENAAVINGGIENRILQPGTPLKIFADIKNCGKRKINDLLVRVYLCDEVMAQNTVTIEPGNVQRVVFRVMPDRSGWVWGAIRIEEDALIPDNAFHFYRWIPEKINVLLVGKSREDVRALRIALSPRNTHRQIFEIKESDPEQDWAAAMENADVVFFSNYPVFRLSESDRLIRFVKNGGGAVFFMGDDVDLRNMNAELFQKELGITLGNIVGGRNGYFSFGMIDFRHPLFEGVFEAGKEGVRSPRFSRIIELAGKVPRRIISFSDGRPFLIERRLGDGNIMIAASGLGEAWTDFSLTTIFAPVISRSAVYLTTPEIAGEEGKYAGESLSFSMGMKDVSGHYRVVNPAGEETLLHPEIKSGKGILKLNRTEEPGIYRFYRDDVLLGMEAVNVDPQESELEPIDRNVLEKRFPKARIVFAEETADLESIVLRTRRGREFWREILLLCMAVLILELLIAREGKRGLSV